MPKSRESHIDCIINENDSYDELYNEMDSYSTSSNNVEDNEYFSDNDDEDVDEYNTNQQKRIYAPPFSPILEKDLGDKDSLNKLKKDHEMNMFKMKLSHCIELKKIELSNITVDVLETKKNELIVKNKSFNEKLIKHQAEKIEKEDEKNTVISVFEGQFTDSTKTRKELYFLQKEKNILEKEHNKKIIAFNMIIGIIDNNINTISDEIHINNITIDQINSDIKNITLKKDEIKKMKYDFLIKLNEFNHEFDIMYENYAKSHGWVILHFRPYSVNENPIENILKDLESPTISISNSISENPISPTYSDGNGFRSSSPAPVISKMEKPIPPSIPVPFMHPIVPIIAKADYGMKPCNNGNTCINPKCRFLHPPQHTIEDGRRNKNELERIERDRFEKEKEEYNYYWDMYENDLEIWNRQDMLKSVEAFPALGGGGKK